ncbi:MAG: DUF6265 family protein [Gemmatimonadota bacterium]
MKSLWLRLGGIAIVGLFVATTPGAAQDPPRDRARDDKPKKEEHKKPPVDLGKLKWMAGCWRGEVEKDTYVEEIWTTPTENLLQAITRVVKKDVATEYEFTRIYVNDTTAVFSASSDGKPFDEYSMKTLVDGYVAFENMKKTFPQKIIYRLTSDGYLIPRNEGEGQTSFEVRMKKMKCPGAS